jgi:hypothetical protein
MTFGALDGLSDGDLRASVGALSVPSAIRTLLARSKPVHAVRTAFAQGEIGKETIHAYIQALLDGFRRGERFEYELELAALCVALEAFHAPFIDKLLANVADLAVAEFAGCSRVVRECIRARSGATVNEYREVQGSTPTGTAEQVDECRFRGRSALTFVCRAA